MSTLHFLFFYILINQFIHIVINFLFFQYNKRHVIPLEEVQGLLEDDGGK